MADLDAEKIMGADEIDAQSHESHLDTALFHGVDCPLGHLHGGRHQRNGVSLRCQFLGKQSAHVIVIVVKDQNRALRDTAAADDIVRCQDMLGAGARDWLAVRPSDAGFELITPWNYPLSMAVWKVAPAVAAGCTVILKPAEQTPLTALRLGELALEAGFPEGVVNVVTGKGDTGAALVAHRGVDKIAFTGSTEVGKKIVQASVGNLKRVSLELGGKSPNIVLPDADLAKAAKAAASGIFSNQGQTCTAGSRLYVHEDVHDAFVDLLVQEARALKIGSGLDPVSDLGPVISQEQLDRILSYIGIGQREGARLACGGGRPAHLDAGYFLEPTVFLGAQQSMRVVQEEIFGPVASVLTWRNHDDLVRNANDSVYGLGAGVWTNDLTNAHHLAQALKAGTVWVNCYNLVDAASPFGGYKESGWGREMGRYAMDLYSETKSIWINLSR